MKAIAAELASAELEALVAPHGGVLRELYLPAAEAEALKRRSASLPQWTLNQRQLCDLELLLNGGFSPLQGFLGRADYDGVVNEMRLADGTLWPIPIVLDVDEAFAAKLSENAQISLNDTQGTPLAVLTVEDVYFPDRIAEAQQVFGTTDRTHPGVSELLDRTGSVYLGGRVQGIQPPAHYDFASLRLSPRELRDWFHQHGWHRIVAFQTRNPMHRAHRELTLRAAEKVGAKLLIQPSVGRTKPGDVDHYTRVRCYRALLEHYPRDLATLSLLPLAMRMGGPREALWHAIIRKNYGASHFIVGRDHAGPGKDSQGKPFYDPYAAQQLLAKHQEELGIEVVPFPAMVYAANRDTYVPQTEVQPDDEVRDISGTELRRRLHNGEAIPEWFTFPDVVKILRERHPANARQGLALFFTGLSGSGKSTLAQAVVARLLETSSRPVTVLDGDEVRRHLSKGLGFSREDRDANITRIGFVASEVVRHGGVVICAPIAPYANARTEARQLVEAHGRFVEIHVSTPLEICEARDRKGLYAAARAGKIKGFTGIDDPYETPVTPELRIDTSQVSVADAANKVFEWLQAQALA
ncbi:bifunctional sulfate adenylyltransferase/adenylylsulfate kinase [Dyella nitratireducens]|uniref:Adenylyl-sulfate kinase n=1 Tax=Dyella nitratireducens TaxID=1849580 RepID=A0ABQ1GPU3_9GAMM|nr:bifunctional sulfate adenylyltransferase/adenylylsulfate kinase [Dyella nitratireducens]GGA47686.1 sulfate adenylyltransferase [Dyella nitratireducens]GLQ42416.1 sulfate adenylyltransferase [Dyella nitratireducens]